MKIRMHRAGLAESIATQQTIEPTLVAVRNYLERELGYFLELFPTQLDGLAVEPYGAGPDDRIGWAQTFVVTTSTGVVAFTDEPILVG